MSSVGDNVVRGAPQTYGEAKPIRRLADDAGDEPRGNGVPIVSPTTTLLGAASLRWREAAARLGLSRPAVHLGEVLLRAEVDIEARAALLGEQAGRIAPWRADLLRAVSSEVPPEASMRGLLELERRQVIRPLRGSAGPWLNLELELDSRVREHCFGASPQPELLAGIVSARVFDSLKQAADLSASRSGQVLVLLRGRRGSGRDTALGVLLRLISGAPPVGAAPHISAAPLMSTAPLTRDVAALRGDMDPLEPELSGAAAVWDARGVDVSPEDLQRATHFLSRSTTVAVALLDPHQDAPDLPERAQVAVSCDALDAAERRALWRAALESASAELGLASAPQLVHGEILAAVPQRLATRNRAGIGLARRALAALPPLGTPLASDSLIQEVEQQLQQLVQPSSTRGIVVEQPNATLDQLIVAPTIRASLNQLLALVSAAEYAPDPRRAGVKALFSGPPGTGKTLAARALASHLGLPIFRVDLSSLVSKWLGETEKNLRHAFDAAESAGALLLFDEGDSLFGKRAQVEKGTDRYANLEVSYLLQALEAHDGVVIVTTNQRSAIDRAFLRRFDIATDFHPPTRDERQQLWLQELRAPGADLPPSLLKELSQVDLSGGHIAAAARLACALATTRTETVLTGAHLYAAIASELSKLGAAALAAQWAARAEK